MEIRTSSFPPEDLNFLICPRRHISEICVSHRASASEPLGFKNTTSRAPDLRQKNTCPVNRFPCGEFYAHHGLRSSVPENSQSYTSANILGFPYVHTLEAETNKGQELWTKSSLSPLGKLPKTRLDTWAMLYATHPKQSRASLFYQPSAIILEELCTHTQGYLPEWANLEPGVSEWSIKYHSIDLMAFKSPSCLSPYAPPCP